LAGRPAKGLFVLLSIIGFICILGPLVVFHELGHFFFARLFGVKAEVFSVGFGPRIWSKQYGETEWRLSVVPLGGYVKLLGEEPGQELPPELAARSLQRQAPWKRFFIFFGGPLFNFILAALVFMAIQVIGEEHVTSRLGRVLPQSIAAKSGLASGDKMIEIAGKKITKYEEIEQVLADFPGKSVEIKVERSGSPQPITLSVTTEAQPGYSAFGEKVSVGDIPGLLPASRDVVVGVSNPASPAAQAGIKTGDRLVSWAGKPVSNFEQIEALDAQTAPGAAVEIVVKSGEKDLKLTWVKSSPEASLAKDMGIYSSELFVDKVVAGSPAEKIGLTKGDRVLAIDDTSVSSFFQLRELVQKAGESKGTLQFSFERDGKRVDQELTPAVSTTRDPEMTKSKQFTVGIFPMLSWVQPEVLIERTFNPFLVVTRGISKMVVLSWRNVVSIGKMFTGDVSVRTLGGPILIGKIAGESMARGLITFLSTMAILSIGLGVLNILPVPVLDGGHILLLGFEVIRGKPLQMKQLEIIQQIGLVLILLLMLVVMKNDFARLF